MSASTPNKEELLDALRRAHTAISDTALCLAGNKDRKKELLHHVHVARWATAKLVVELKK